MEREDPPVEATMTLDIGCARCRHPQSDQRIAGEFAAGRFVTVTVTCPACSNVVIFNNVAVR